MKSIIILILLCLFYETPEIKAQDIIEKKLDNGDDVTKYVWVILAEGYTESELEKFQSDVSLIIDGFFSASPFKEYKSAINLYTVFTASYDSGADHPSSGIYVDTSFDATFETYGIDRLLTVDDEKALKAASEISYFDVVFALVNDNQYGGSGGSVIAVSTNRASIEIALHEAGHVIGRLADEYETEYPGYPKGDYEPNVTYQDERQKIPWKIWIDPNTPVPTPDDYPSDVVGLFEGARYFPEDIYRPKKDCKMRSLNDPYCEICRETLVLQIYNIVNPIEKTGPVESAVELAPGNEINLWVEPIKLNGSVYDSLWEVDEKILEDEFQISLSLSPSFFKQGEHTVSVWISDTTEMVQNDSQGLLTSKKTWSINKAFCSGKLVVGLADRKTGQEITDAAVWLPATGDSLTINNDGRYELSDVACGTYSITTDTEGFINAEQEVSIIDGEISALDIFLDPSEGNYYISGDISGDILEEVSVELSGDLQFSVKAEKDGVFILGPVTPGTYTVTPDIPGYRFSPGSRTIDVVDKNISEISFAAQYTGLLFLISGIIQGDVKEGIIVSVAGQKNATTVTDSQGNFQLEDLPTGQYVLKPGFTGVTFEPDKLEVELGEEDLKELKFLAKEAPCPAAYILLQNSSCKSTLRKFRDNILTKSIKGSYYIRVYYLAGSEVNRILLKNRSIKAEALLVLNECMPVIKKILKGEKAEFTGSTKTNIKNFAKHLSKHGSPLLKKIIEQFLVDLHNGKIF